MYENHVSYYFVPILGSLIPLAPKNNYMNNYMALFFFVVTIISCPCLLQNINVKNII